MVGRRDRLTPFGLVAREILLRDDPAASLHSCDERVRDLAPVECIGSLLGDQPECPRERGLPKPRSRLERRAVRKERRLSIEPLDVIAVVVERGEEHAVDDETFIGETNRRRDIQTEYNEENGITPRGIQKDIRTLSDRLRAVEAEGAASGGGLAIAAMPRDEIMRIVKDLEAQMKRASRELEFEKAAELRDQIVELRRALVE